MDGVGGAGSVVVDDCDGDVMSTCFGELMAGIIDATNGVRTIAEVPGDGVGVVNSFIAIVSDKGNRFSLIDVGINRFIDYQCRGEVIYC